MIIYTEGVYKAVNDFYGGSELEPGCIYDIAEYIREASDVSGTDTVSPIINFIEYNKYSKTFTVKKEFHICQLLNEIRDESGNKIDFNFRIPNLNLEVGEEFDGSNSTIDFAFKKEYVNNFYNIDKLTKKINTFTRNDTHREAIKRFMVLNHIGYSVTTGFLETPLHINQVEVKHTIVKNLILKNLDIAPTPSNEYNEHHTVDLLKKEVQDENSYEVNNTINQVFGGTTSEYSTVMNEYSDVTVDTMLLRFEIQPDNKDILDETYIFGFINDDNIILDICSVQLADTEVDLFYYSIKDRLTLSGKYNLYSKLRDNISYTNTVELFDELLSKINITTLVNIIKDINISDATATIIYNSIKNNDDTTIRDKSDLIELLQTDITIDYDKYKILFLYDLIIRKESPITFVNNINYDDFNWEEYKDIYFNHLLGNTSIENINNTANDLEDLLINHIPNKYGISGEQLNGYTISGEPIIELNDSTYTISYETFNAGLSISAESFSIETISAESFSTETISGDITIKREVLETINDGDNVFYRVRVTQVPRIFIQEITISKLSLIHSFLYYTYGSNPNIQKILALYQDIISNTHIENIDYYLNNSTKLKHRNTVAVIDTINQYSSKYNTKISEYIELLLNNIKNLKDVHFNRELLPSIDYRGALYCLINENRGNFLSGEVNDIHKILYNSDEPVSIDQLLAKLILSDISTDLVPFKALKVINNYLQNILTSPNAIRLASEVISLYTSIKNNIQITLDSIDNYLYKNIILLNSFNDNYIQNSTNLLELILSYILNEREVTTNDIIDNFEIYTPYRSVNTGASIRENIENIKNFEKDAEGNSLILNNKSLALSIYIKLIKKYTPIKYKYFRYEGGILLGSYSEWFKIINCKVYNNNVAHKKLNKNTLKRITSSDVETLSSIYNGLSNIPANVYKNSDPNPDSGGSALYLKNITISDYLITDNYTFQTPISYYSMVQRYIHGDTPEEYGYDYQMYGYGIFQYKLGGYGGLVGAFSSCESSNYIYKSSYKGYMYGNLNGGGIMGANSNHNVGTEREPSLLVIHNCSVDIKTSFTYLDPYYLYSNIYYIAIPELRKGFGGIIGYNSCSTTSVSDILRCNVNINTSIYLDLFMEPYNKLQYYILGLSKRDFEGKNEKYISNNVCGGGIIGGNCVHNGGEVSIKKCLVTGNLYTYNQTNSFGGLIGANSGINLNNSEENKFSVVHIDECAVTLKNYAFGVPELLELASRNRTSDGVEITEYDFIEYNEDAPLYNAGKMNEMKRQADRIWDTYTNRGQNGYYYIYAVKDVPNFYLNKEEYDYCIQNKLITPDEVEPRHHRNRDNSTFGEAFIELFDTTDVQEELYKSRYIDRKRIELFEELIRKKKYVNGVQFSSCNYSGGFVGKGCCNGIATFIIENSTFEGVLATEFGNDYVGGFCGSEFGLNSSLSIIRNNVFNGFILQGDEVDFANKLYDTGGESIKYSHSVAPASAGVFIGFNSGNNNSVINLLYNRISSYPARVKQGNVAMVQETNVSIHPTTPGSITGVTKRLYDTGRLNKRYLSAGETNMMGLSKLSNHTQTVYRDNGQVTNFNPMLSNFISEQNIGTDSYRRDDDIDVEGTLLFRQVMKNELIARNFDYGALRANISSGYSSQNFMNFSNTMKITNIQENIISRNGVITPNGNETIKLFDINKYSSSNEYNKDMMYDRNLNDSILTNVLLDSNDTYQVYETENSIFDSTQGKYVIVRTDINGRETLEYTDTYYMENQPITINSFNDTTEYRSDMYSNDLNSMENYFRMKDIRNRQFVASEEHSIVTNGYYTDVLDDNQTSQMRTTASRETAIQDFNSFIQYINNNTDDLLDFYDGEILNTLVNIRIMLQTLNKIIDTGVTSINVSDISLDILNEDERIFISDTSNIDLIELVNSISNMNEELTMSGDIFNPSYIEQILIDNGLDVDGDMQTNLRLYREFVNIFDVSDMSNTFMGLYSSFNTALVATRSASILLLTIQALHPLDIIKGTSLWFIQKVLSIKYGISNKTALAVIAVKHQMDINRKWHVEPEFTDYIDNFLSNDNPAIMSVRNRRMRIEAEQSRLSSIGYIEPPVADVTEAVYVTQEKAALDGYIRSLQREHLQDTFVDDQVDILIEEYNAVEIGGIAGFFEMDDTFRQSIQDAILDKRCVKTALSMSELSTDSYLGLANMMEIYNKHYTRMSLLSQLYVYQQELDAGRMTTTSTQFAEYDSLRTILIESEDFPELLLLTDDGLQGNFTVESIKRAMDSETELLSSSKQRYNTLNEDIATKLEELKIQKTRIESSIQDFIALDDPNIVELINKEKQLLNKVNVEISSFEAYQAMNDKYSSSLNTIETQTKTFNADIINAVESGDYRKVQVYFDRHIDIFPNETEDLRILYSVNAESFKLHSQEFIIDFENPSLSRFQYNSGPSYHGYNLKPEHLYSAEYQLLNGGLETRVTPLIQRQTELNQLITEGEANGKTDYQLRDLKTELENIDKKIDYYNKKATRLTNNKLYNIPDYRSASAYIIGDSITDGVKIFTDQSELITPYTMGIDTVTSPELRVLSLNARTEHEYFQRAVMSNRTNKEFLEGNPLSTRQTISQDAIKETIDDITSKTSSFDINITNIKSHLARINNQLISIDGLSLPDNNVINVKSLYGDTPGRFIPSDFNEVIFERTGLDRLERVTTRLESIRTVTDIAYDSEMQGIIVDIYYSGIVPDINSVKSNVLRYYTENYPGDIADSIRNSIDELSESDLLLLNTHGEHNFIDTLDVSLKNSGTIQEALLKTKSTGFEIGVNSPYRPTIQGVTDYDVTFDPNYNYNVIEATKVYHPTSSSVDIPTMQDNVRQYIQNNHSHLLEEFEILVDDMNISIEQLNILGPDAVPDIAEMYINSEAKLQLLHVQAQHQSIPVLSEFLDSQSTLDDVFSNTYRTGFTFKASGFEVEATKIPALKSVSTTAYDTNLLDIIDQTHPDIATMDISIMKEHIREYYGNKYSDSILGQIDEFSEVDIKLLYAQSVYNSVPQIEEVVSRGANLNEAVTNVKIIGFDFNQTLDITRTSVVDDAFNASLLKSLNKMHPVSATVDKATMQSRIFAYFESIYSNEEYAKLFVDNEKLMSQLVELSEVDMRLLYLQSQYGCINRLDLNLKSQDDLLQAIQETKKTGFTLNFTTESVVTFARDTKAKLDIELVRNTNIKLQEKKLLDEIYSSLESIQKQALQFNNNDILSAIIEGREGIVDGDILAEARLLIDSAENEDSLNKIVSSINNKIRAKKVDDLIVQFNQLKQKCLMLDDSSDSKEVLLYFVNEAKEKLKLSTTELDTVRESLSKLLPNTTGDIALHSALYKRHTSTVGMLELRDPVTKRPLVETLGEAIDTVNSRMRTDLGTRLSINPNGQSTGDAIPVETLVTEETPSSTIRLELAKSNAEAATDKLQRAMTELENAEEAKNILLGRVEGTNPEKLLEANRRIERAEVLVTKAETSVVEANKQLQTISRIVASEQETLSSLDAARVAVDNATAEVIRIESEIVVRTRKRDVQKLITETIEENASEAAEALRIADETVASKQAIFDTFDGIFKEKEIRLEELQGILRQAEERQKQLSSIIDAQGYTVEELQGLRIQKETLLAMSGEKQTTYLIARNRLIQAKEELERVTDSLSTYDETLKLNIRTKLSLENTYKMKLSELLQLDHDIRNLKSTISSFERILDYDVLTGFELNEVMGTQNNIKQFQLNRQGVVISGIESELYDITSRIEENIRRVDRSEKKKVDAEKVVADKNTALSSKNTALIDAKTNYGRLQESFEAAEILAETLEQQIYLPNLTDDEYTSAFELISESRQSAFKDAEDARNTAQTAVDNKQIEYDTMLQDTSVLDEIKTQTLTELEELKSVLSEAENALTNAKTAMESTVPSSSELLQMQEITISKRIIIADNARQEVIRIESERQTALSQVDVAQENYNIAKQELDVAQETLTQRTSIYNDFVAQLVEKQHNKAMLEIDLENAKQVWKEIEQSRVTLKLTDAEYDSAVETAKYNRRQKINQTNIELSEVEARREAKLLEERNALTEVENITNTIDNNRTTNIQQEILRNNLIDEINTKDALLPDLLAEYEAATKAYDDVFEQLAAVDYTPEELMEIYNELDVVNTEITTIKTDVARATNEYQYARSNTIQPKEELDIAKAEAETARTSSLELPIEALEERRRLDVAEDILKRAEVALEDAQRQVHISAGKLAAEEATSSSIQLATSEDIAAAIEVSEDSAREALQSATETAQRRLDDARVAETRAITELEEASAVNKAATKKLKDARRNLLIAEDAVATAEEGVREVAGSASDTLRIEAQSKLDIAKINLETVRAEVRNVALEVIDAVNVEQQARQLVNTREIDVFTAITELRRAEARVEELSTPTQTTSVVDEVRPTPAAQPDVANFRSQGTESIEVVERVVIGTTDNPSIIEIITNDERLKALSVEIETEVRKRAISESVDVTDSEAVENLLRDVEIEYYDETMRLVNKPLDIEIPTKDDIIKYIQDNNVDIPSNAINESGELSQEYIHTIQKRIRYNNNLQAYKTARSSGDDVTKFIVKGLQKNPVSKNAFREFSKRLSKTLLKVLFFPVTLPYYTTKFVWGVIKGTYQTIKSIYTGGKALVKLYKELAQTIAKSTQAGEVTIKVAIKAIRALLKVKGISKAVIGVKAAKNLKNITKALFAVGVFDVALEIILPFLFDFIASISATRFTRQQFLLERSIRNMNHTPVVANKYVAGGYKCFQNSSYPTIANASVEGNLLDQLINNMDDSPWKTILTGITNINLVRVLYNISPLGFADAMYSLGHLDQSHTGFTTFGHMFVDNLAGDNVVLRENPMWKLVVDNNNVLQYDSNGVVQRSPYNMVSGIENGIIFIKENTLKGNYRFNGSLDNITMNVDGRDSDISFNELPISDDLKETYSEIIIDGKLQLAHSSIDLNTDCGFVMLNMNVDTLEDDIYFRLIDAEVKGNLSLINRKIVLDRVEETSLLQLTIDSAGSFDDESFRLTQLDNNTHRYQPEYTRMFIDTTRVMNSNTESYTWRSDFTQLNYSVASGDDVFVDAWSWLTQSLVSHDFKTLGELRRETQDLLEIIPANNVENARNTIAMVYKGLAVRKGNNSLNKYLRNNIENSDKKLILRNNGTYTIHKFDDEMYNGEFVVQTVEKNEDLSFSIVNIIEYNENKWYINNDVTLTIDIEFEFIESYSNSFNETRQDSDKVIISEDVIAIIKDCSLNASIINYGELRIQNVYCNAVTNYKVLYIDSNSNINTLYNIHDLNIKLVDKNEGEEDEYLYFITELYNLSDASLNIMKLSSNISFTINEIHNSGYIDMSNAYCECNTVYNSGSDANLIFNGAIDILYDSKDGITNILESSSIKRLLFDMDDNATINRNITDIDGLYNYDYVWDSLINSITENSLEKLYNVRPNTIIVNRTYIYDLVENSNIVINNDISLSIYTSDNSEQIINKIYNSIFSIGLSNCVYVNENGTIENVNLYEKHSVPDSILSILETSDVTNGVLPTISGDEYNLIFLTEMFDEDKLFTNVIDDVFIDNVKDTVIINNQIGLDSLELNVVTNDIINITSISNEVLEAYSYEYPGLEIYNNINSKIDSLVSLLSENTEIEHPIRDVSINEKLRILTNLPNDLGQKLLDDVSNGYISNNALQQIYLSDDPVETILSPLKYLEYRGLDKYVVQDITRDYITYLSENAHSKIYLHDNQLYYLDSRIAGISINSTILKYCTEFYNYNGYDDNIGEYTFNKVDYSDVRQYYTQTNDGVYTGLYCKFETPTDTRYYHIIHVYTSGISSPISYIYYSSQPLFINQKQANNIQPSVYFANKAVDTDNQILYSFNEDRLNYYKNSVKDINKVIIDDNTMITDIFDNAIIPGITYVNDSIKRYKKLTLNLKLGILNSTNNVKNNTFNIGLEHALTVDYLEVPFRVTVNVEHNNTPTINVNMYNSHNIFNYPYKVLPNDTIFEKNNSIYNNTRIVKWSKRTPQYIFVQSAIDNLSWFNLYNSDNKYLIGNYYKYPDIKYSGVSLDSENNPQHSYIDVDISSTFNSNITHLVLNDTQLSNINDVDIKFSIQEEYINGVNNDDFLQIVEQKDLTSVGEYIFNNTVKVIDRETYNSMLSFTNTVYKIIVPEINRTNIFKDIYGIEMDTKIGTEIKSQHSQFRYNRITYSSNIEQLRYNMSRIKFVLNSYSKKISDFIFFATVESFAPNWEIPLLIKNTNSLMPYIIEDGVPKMLLVVDKLYEIRYNDAIKNLLLGPDEEIGYNLSLRITDNDDISYNTNYTFVSDYYLPDGSETYCHKISIPELVKIEYTEENLQYYYVDTFQYQYLRWNNQTYDDINITGLRQPYVNSSNDNTAMIDYFIFKLPEGKNLRNNNIIYYNNIKVTTTDIDGSTIDVSYLIIEPINDNNYRMMINNDLGLSEGEYSCKVLFDYADDFKHSIIYNVRFYYYPSMRLNNDISLNHTINMGVPTEIKMPRLLNNDNNSVSYLIGLTDNAQVKIQYKENGINKVHTNTYTWNYSTDYFVVPYIENESITIINDHGDTKPIQLFIYAINNNDKISENNITYDINYSLNNIDTILGLEYEKVATMNNYHVYIFSKDIELQDLSISYTMGQDSEYINTYIFKYDTNNTLIIDSTNESNNEYVKDNVLYDINSADIMNQLTYGNVYVVVETLPVSGLFVYNKKTFNVTFEINKNYYSTLDDYINKQNAIQREFDVTLNVDIYGTIPFIDEKLDENKIYRNNLTYTLENVVYNKNNNFTGRIYNFDIDHLYKIGYTYINQYDYTYNDDEFIYTVRMLSNTYDNKEISLSNEDISYITIEKTQVPQIINITNSHSVISASIDSSNTLLLSSIIDISTIIFDTTSNKIIFNNNAYYYDPTQLIVKSGTIHSNISVNILNNDTLSGRYLLKTSRIEMNIINNKLIITEYLISDNDYEFDISNDLCTVKGVKIYNSDIYTNNNSIKITGNNIVKKSIFNLTNIKYDVTDISYYIDNENNTKNISGKYIDHIYSSEVLDISINLDEYINNVDVIRVTNYRKIGYYTNGDGYKYYDLSVNDIIGVKPEDINKLNIVNGTVELCNLTLYNEPGIHNSYIKTEHDTYTVSIQGIVPPRIYYNSTNSIIVNEKYITFREYQLLDDKYTNQSLNSYIPYENINYNYLFNIDDFIIKTFNNSYIKTITVDVSSEFIDVIYDASKNVYLKQNRNIQLYEIIKILDGEEYYNAFVTNVDVTVTDSYGLSDTIRISTRIKITRSIIEKTLEQANETYGNIIFNKYGFITKQLTNSLINPNTFIEKDITIDTDKVTKINNVLNDTTIPLITSSESSNTVTLNSGVVSDYINIVRDLGYIGNKHTVTKEFFNTVIQNVEKQTTQTNVKVKFDSSIREVLDVNTDSTRGILLVQPTNTYGVTTEISDNVIDIETDLADSDIFVNIENEGESVTFTLDKGVNYTNIIYTTKGYAIYQNDEILKDAFGNIIYKQRGQTMKFGSYELIFGSLVFTLSTDDIAFVTDMTVGSSDSIILNDTQNTLVTIRKESLENYVVTYTVSGEIITYNSPYNQLLNINGEYVYIGTKEEYTTNTDTTEATNTLASNGITQDKIENIQNIVISNNNDMVTVPIISEDMLQGKTVSERNVIRHNALDSVFKLNPNITMFKTTPDNISINDSINKDNVIVTRANQQISLSDMLDSNSGIYTNLTNINDYVTFKNFDKTIDIVKTSDTTYKVTGQVNGIFNEGDKANLIGYEFFFGGVGTNGKVIGSSSGDPHIYPMYGKLYELPNRVDTYRMLQGNGLTMNACTRKVTSEESNDIKEYYKAVVGEEAPTSLLTNGVFYKSVYLESEGHKLLFKFDELKGITNGKNYFNVQTKYTNTNNMNKYEQSSMMGQIIVTFNHSEYGKCEVCFNHFSNPQIKYGISTNIQHKDGLSGLLVREYLSNTMSVPTLNDTRKVNGISIKNVVSTYFNQ